MTRIFYMLRDPLATLKGHGVGAADEGIFAR